MFFAKALGGSLVAVFGGLYLAGFFGAPSGLTSHEEGVITAANTVRQAELARNKTAKWGPECDALRDKVMGVEDGGPVGLASGNALQGIAKLAQAEAQLKAKGCDVNAAPGAFSPFTPEKNKFRAVTTQLEASDPYAGGHPDDDWVDPYEKAE